MNIINNNLCHFHVNIASSVYMAVSPIPVMITTTLMKFSIFDTFDSKMASKMASNIGHGSQHGLSEVKMASNMLPTIGIVSSITLHMWISMASCMASNIII